jgi:2-iminobutanoate/2-iminopropanoate deaminase
MEGIKKEHVIAGVIGGVTSLALAMIARRVMRKAWKRGGCGKKWGRGESKLLTMQSDKMPQPVGPYSFGKMIQNPNGSMYGWSSGQLGLDPVTGELVQGEDPVVAQAEQILTNLQNLAADNGFDLEKHCVKNVVYLVDMADFAKVNQVYTRFFKKDYPARTCIAIKALPKGGLVEIESVFFKPSEGGKPCEK